MDGKIIVVPRFLAEVPKQAWQPPAKNLGPTMILPYSVSNL